MEEKKLSRAEIRREKEKKRARNERIFIIVVALALIAVLVGVVALLQKKAKENPETKPGQLPEEEVVIDEAKAAAYSSGLDNNGLIEGINNISDYVTLGDYNSFEIYNDDFAPELDHGQIVKSKENVVGEYILHNLVFTSKVEIYQPYYDTMVDLYDFIYHDELNTYNMIYESNNKSTWDDVYSFYGITELEYNNKVSENALYDARYYMICQAVAAKENISVDEKDILEYCYSREIGATDEKEAKKIVAKFGEKYTKQRALEWKLKNYLGANATLKEGSRYDSLTDESDFYGQGLYENGKIDGVGNIISYCGVVDLDNAVANAGNGEEVLNILLTDCDFKEATSYYEVLLSQDFSEETAKSKMNRDLLIQFLYEKFKIDKFDYLNDYILDNELTLESKEELSYRVGDAYFSRLLMDYSVVKYLDVLIAN